MTQGDRPFAQEHSSLLFFFQFTPPAFKSNMQVTYMKTESLTRVLFATAADFLFEVMSSIMSVFILCYVKGNSLWLSEIHSLSFTFPRHLSIQAALGDFHSLYNWICPYTSLPYL